MVKIALAQAIETRFFSLVQIGQILEPLREKAIAFRLPQAKFDVQIVERFDAFGYGTGCCCCHGVEICIVRTLRDA